MEWLKVPLEKLCDIIIGATPSRQNSLYWGGNNVWITIRELRGETIYDSNEHITDLGVKESPSKLISAGTLLFSFKLSIGKIGIAGRDLYTNEAIAGLPIKKNTCLDRDFLKYCLQSIDTLGDSEVSVKGALLNKKKIAKIQIPLPPLSEQKRIVEILDRANELRKQRAEADALSERILPALFIKMFGDPVNWDVEQTEPLGKLVNIQSGGTPSKKNPNYWDGDIPWVSAKDMKKDIIYESMDHLTDLAIKETNVKYVEAGSILMVVRGMILAHTIPIALAGTRLTINQDMKALMPNCNKINSSYLHATLKALNKVILSQVGTAGHGTRKFDTEYLLKLPIFIPSQENLKKFDLVSLESQKIISQISQARSKLDNLFQTLVHRAFSGDLTAQWREAHMTELLQEMEYQTKALNLQPTLF